MRKTLDMYIKNLPDSSFKIGVDKYVVFLGEDYGRTPVRGRACGVFMGSADKKVGEVEFQVGTKTSYTVLQNIAKLEDKMVLLLDTSGFYLMDRVTAMEISGQLADV